MGRPKKVAEKKAPKERKDPRIEEVYEEEVTFMCPIRGLVTQKVKVKRFKPLSQQNVKYKTSSSDAMSSQLEAKDDGLAIYDEGEELGIENVKAEEEE